jgi:hypothetical protein
MQNSAEALEHSVNSSTSQMKDISDCCGCPFDSFPKAKSPERTRFGIPAEAPPVVAHTAFVDSFNRTAKRESRIKPRTTVSPPLELLSTLRL